MKMNFRMAPWLLAFAALTLVACGEKDEPTPGAEAVDDPILEDVSVLLDGAPSNDELPDLAKADQNFPPSYTELAQLQSPVKSQGSRGVCSIFSTAAYMEHLYIAEGTITDLDVSEQYLQWSAKFEVGSFPNTSGSNANYNLQAISDYGIPREEAWPYETSQWSSSNDAECTGDEMPTKCYTNGEPPDSARSAEKFKLPRSRYISTRERDIKSHMFNQKTGVVVGLTFFYQSWNHRRSTLPRNTQYWDQGYVLYPNSKDEEVSLEKRAGHSILLVGWDDNLEVPVMDEEGNQVLNADGTPITERGFFLFKNSWGTGSFGRLNPNGDGFGWISYRYVNEYGSGRVTDLPEIDAVTEICGDGIDNDGNFVTDCNDDACAADPICVGGGDVIDLDLGAGGLAIPDNDSNGASASFDVTGAGTISAMTISVDITHTYRGDISIKVVHPDGTVADLLTNSSDGQDNIVASYVVEDFVGKDAAGTYQLIFADHAALDTGVVNSATVEIAR